MKVTRVGPLSPPLLRCLPLARALALGEPVPPGRGLPPLPFLPVSLSLLRLPFPLPPAGAERAELTRAGLLKATALEAAVLAGHLLLYPSGLVQERRGTLTHSSDGPHVPDGPPEVPPDGRPLSLPAPPLPRESRESRESRDGRSDTPDRTDPGPPVVLLHGFVDNRSVFVLLRRVLGRHGRRVEALNHSPLTCDIRTAAGNLGRYVEELCARTGRDEVDLVGHSLGGLIARYYVQRLGGDARVRTVVTLGTPHAGTRAVPLMDLHPVVRQMRPDSEVIAELALPAPGCRTRFVSFWSDLDQVMDPLETARLDHPDLLARAVRVSGVGHLALPVHPTVTAGVRAALDGDGPGGEATDGTRHARALRRQPHGNVTDVTPRSGNRGADGRTAA
ncbi:esterase/lipase family protein [Streptomyces sp. NPDC059816]|uniref:esterase/lipase family protein n=1 Tax=Streptomyces sp. NPDC059816 TaxID=3346960 RepID=UPI0036519A2E